MTEKELIAKEETVEGTVQMQGQAEAKPVSKEVISEEVKKEKTAEDLALEQGYYACCFRSH